MTVKDEITNPWKNDNYQQEKFDSHDDNCLSLYYFWFAHKGGVSCPGDLDDCLNCGVTFYTEGIVHPRWNDKDYEWDEGLCACCAEGLGYKVGNVMHYGLSLDS